MVNTYVFVKVFDEHIISHENLIKGAFNNYVGKMRGGGGLKMSVFVHAQGIKNVHAGMGGSKNGKILST